MRFNIKNDFTPEEEEEVKRENVVRGALRVRAAPESATAALKAGASPRFVAAGRVGAATLLHVLLAAPLLAVAGGVLVGCPPRRSSVRAERRRRGSRTPRRAASPWPRRATVAVASGLATQASPIVEHDCAREQAAV